MKWKYVIVDKDMRISPLQAKIARDTKLKRKLLIMDILTFIYNGDNHERTEEQIFALYPSPYVQRYLVYMFLNRLVQMRLLKCVPVEE